MRTHNYLARIDDEIWLDLNRVNNQMEEVSTHFSWKVQERLEIKS